MRGDDTPDYDTVRVRSGPGNPRLETTRPGSNVVTTTPLSDTVLDLQGIHINECWVSDLDQYTVRVDDDTHVREMHEYAATTPTLTEREQELSEKIYNRPLFPVDRYDGSVFTYDDLKRDIVMDEERRGLFGSLVQKGAIHPLDDGYYVLVDGTED